jgi:hypothetical protein
LTEGPFQLFTQGPGATSQAGNVITDVDYSPGAGSEREKAVEAGNPVGFSRRDVESLADVIQGTLADPAESTLNGVESWKQEMALGSHAMSVKGYVPVEIDKTLPTPPARLGRTEHAVNGRGFG